MPQKLQFASIHLLKGGLAQLGYTHEQFKLGGKLYSLFTNKAGKTWYTANAHVNYPFAASTARVIAEKKHLAYELATQLGIPTPRTYRVENRFLHRDQIMEMLSQAPLIVKPDDSSLSQGLTMNITTADQLMLAIDHANTISPAVLVQKQVSGEEIRFAVFDGKVTAAILRQRLRVTGDGTRTIKQLVAAENAARRQLQFDYLTYPQITDDVVVISAKKLAQTPGDGEVVVLGQNSMLRWGSSLYNITNEVDSSYKLAVEKLTASFGKGFLVVDMLVQDYTQPLTPDNYSFMEFNMSPVLNHFYSTRDGKTYDIVGVLSRKIDASL